MQSGFTLVEMAVVLFIIAILLGGLLLPLTAQIDQRNLSEAQKQLDEIKDALMGFAIINGRLPCPDTTGDGVEDTCPSVLVTETTGGNLPWVTLGMPNQDPWNQAYQYRVNNAYTTTFTLSTTPSGNGVLRVCSDSTCASLLASSVPAVVYSSGKNGAIQPPVGADEQENANNDRTFVSHAFSNVSGSEFDDIVVWLSQSVLANRMVAAGKLP